jgi:hypothetical protein
VVAHLDKEKPNSDPKNFLTVLIDQTGTGFIQDEPTLVQVMIQDRIEQAHYYRDHIFNGKQPSAYLYRYIHWVMLDDCAKPPKYSTDQSILDANMRGELTAESEEFKLILNYINYCKHNPEIAHLIGLVQLVGGSLKAAAKQKNKLRIFIEHPETGMHPKRERLLVSLLHRLRDQYGFKTASEADVETLEE